VPYALGTREKRTEKRDFFSVTLEYSYPSSEECPDDNCKSSAITTNISPHGMGIYTDRPLSAGLHLSLKSGKVSDRTFSAEVRWCKQVSDVLYRVGLMFEGLTACPA
jgi:hypothetical protein